ncbi:hypothetical protein DL96DRAFT_1477311, partial [Flagelloscypha sp. PMI_526]
IAYQPSYSPDLTPIEESFSALKAEIRRNSSTMRVAEDPITALLDATACITPEKCQGWFEHAGYIL